MEELREISEMLFVIFGILLAIDFVERKGLGGDEPVRSYLSMTNEEFKKVPADIDKVDASRLRLYAQVHPWFLGIWLSSLVLYVATYVFGP